MPTPPPAPSGVLRGAVAHWAVATPDAVALTCGTEHVTYAELAGRVHRTARLLRRHGVGPEHLVGLAGTRSIDLVVALLGVIEAGGAYVPLDPEYPAERLDGLVADAGLDLVVTTGAVPWAPTGADVVALDHPGVRAELAALDPTPVPAAEVGLTPAHAAYVIYTSGSTGTPKGCVVTHACVDALLAGTEGWFGFGPDDVWTLFHSYAFDFTVWELWGALRYGGRLVIVDEATRRSPDDLWALLRSEGVTVLNQTPTAFSQLVEADRAAGPAPDLALRVVVFGGEALDLARLGAWYDRHPDDAPALVNMFGITETTVHVTYLRLDRETAASAPGSLVGEAIPGLEVHVLDDRLEPVGEGVTGEIYVSGAQLARGYLGRPALTAARFVASPFGPPGSRLYRSGDVGRWVAPGVLEHRGRADAQVKVRGYRIEPGEVEAALRALAGVRDAVVTTRPRPDGDGLQLVGYVVPADGATVDPGALRAALADVVPAHLVPSVLVPIDAVPLTVNGKLDHAALPDPRAARARGGAPRTATEQAVADAFAEVLGVDGLGPDDDLFALGGDSLLAVRAANLLRARLRVALTGGRIHDARTVAAVAAAVDEAAATVRPREVAADGPAPLAHGQRRMWAQSAFDGDSTAYHVPVAWRIEGPVDAEALRHALDAVADRHEVLRTLVDVADDGPRPRVVAGATVPLATRWAPAERLVAEAEALTAGPFDLGRDLPLRAALVSAAHDEHVLRVEVHHAAVDEWSLPVLARDLGVAYAARVAGAAPAWEPLPVQLGQVARWEQARAAAAAERVDGLVAALAGAPEETALPADRPRTGEPTSPAAEVAFTVDGAAAEHLRALAAGAGTTAFAVLAAAVARVLRAEGAGDDVVLGTTVTDRADPDLDDLVGYLSNTVALRIDLAGADDLATAVARTRAALIAGLDHASVPFDRVVDALAPPRAPGRHPLFQVMVVGDDHAAQAAAPELASARVERIRVPDRHARFDLEWHVEEQPDGTVAGRLVYATARFDAATAARLAQAVVTDLTPSATGDRIVRGTVRSDHGLAGVVAAELAAVVGVDAVGPDEDFFALGGDSIMAIQLANRLRRRGITLSPWEVFRLRTAAAMAAAAGRPDAAPAPVAEAEAEATDVDHGPLPLTPIAHRLREWGGPIERFNQSALVTTPAGFTAADVEARVGALVAAHGALRQRLHRPDARLWSLEVRAEGEAGFTVVDASATEPGSAERRRLVADESDRAADRLDPDAGVMAQAVWFDGGAGAEGRLLLVVHHLAVDGVSWSVLLDDLRTGAPAPSGASLRRHATALAERAQRPDRAAELGHWLATLAPGAELVPEPVAPGTVADTSVAVVTIPPAEAGPLLTTVPGAARTEVTEVLLAGLALAVGRARPDGADLLVDLERHGRDLDHGLDVSGTVGWFTAIAPVRLAAAPTAVDAVQRVREAVAATPDRGAGYGQLRYLHPVAGPLLAAEATPQVLFDYLGRYGADAEAEADAGWSAAPEADALRSGPAPGMGAGHVLAVDVFRRETPDGPALEARFTHRHDVLPAEEAAALAEGWRRALGDIAAAVADAPLPLGPADLDLVDLDADALAAVAATVTGRVEDVWPLSPLQEGLLFEAQLGGEAYTAQLALDLDHPLDPARVGRALRSLLHRHPTLRAAFTTAGAEDAPVQAIVADPEVVVPEVDLRGLAPDEREARLAEVMATDRDTPFDLTRPPLCRCTVVHLDEGADRLIVNRQVLLWDGWSVLQVTRELLALYETDGDPSGLEPLPVGFPDYLRWLRAQDSDTALARWRTELDGVDGGALVFPSALGAVDLSRPEVHHLTLPDDLTADLRATAAALGVTLNSVLNAALALVLGFVSGSDDVTFGSTVSGRPTDVEGLDRVVGLFINTVPVRTGLGPDLTLADLVQQVHERRVDLMAHDFVGLAAIQRAAGRGQLFDVLYVLQNFEDYEGTAAMYRHHGVVGEEFEDHTQYPLTVVVAPDRRIRLRIEARPDLIGEGTAEALTGRYVQALEAVARRPRQRTAEVDLLLPGEIDALRTLTTSLPGPAELRTVADELAATAADTPDLVGLVCGDERLTFAELDARADRLARLYRAHGAGPETVVALGLGRCVDMVVSMVAVLRTGAAYLPLELDHPPARLREMVADAGAVLTVVRAATAGAVGSAGTVLVLDAPAVVAELDATPAEPLTDAELGAFARTEPTRLERPAYVVYTSGSTGRPKGVVTPHRGLTNMLRNHHERIFAPALDEAGGRRFKVAHTVSFAFDMSWEEILWLIAGHEVHVCDEELRRDAAGLVAYCDEHRIDVVNVTPTYARILLDEGLLATDDGGHRPPLVMLGGEAISESVWTALRDTPGTSGYNLYGPTEYTINALGGGTADSATPTIGRPIMGTDALVLDGWLRPVPVGVPGELYLCGVGTARGYHDRPGLTASSFVAAPDRPGERMYRTGDLVRVRPDGNVDYLGRTDDQVKVRGHRVEPAEVASVLDAHDRVRSSAVVAVPDPAGGQRLVAYVVPAADDGEARRDDEAAHVVEWQGVYEGEYDERITALLREDYSGWTSSDDGSPIPFAEMHRWRQDAADRIRELRPRRIAELGVGGGLILAALAADESCEEYWGTDLSPTVIAGLERDLAQVELPATVTVRAQAADDVSGMPAGHFDVVVINSVIQHLPSLDHLREVLAGALTLLAPGGSVFVGDARHHGLIDLFHAGVQTHRADPGATVGTVAATARRRADMEKDLLVDPDWFAALAGSLPGVAGVDLRIKEVDHDNELSRYRYDVVLRTAGGTPVEEAPVEGLAWGVDVTDAAGLKGALAAETRPALRLAGVPNVRLARDLALDHQLRTADPDAAVDDPGPAPDTLDALAEVARSAGYQVTWTWNGADPTLVDAVLRRDGSTPLVGTYRPGTDGTRPPGNDPLGVRRRAALVATLRDHLRSRLPDHMVPAAVVVVDHLPLTTNGKLDVAALPEPDVGPTASGRPPATALEAAVCAVVADVLGLPSIGADDNFFLLGGHSLLAMRLVARLKAEVGGELRVSDVMAGQTPEAFAAALEAAPEGRGGDSDLALAPVLRIGARSGPALFCVHPLFGLSWVYAGLARHLDGHTIYGLQSSLHSGGPAAPSLEALARGYADEVRRLVPDGPYHLLGWSFGGPVAHRMACALQADGAEIGSLVIVDSVPSEAETWRAAGDERDREYAEWYLGPLPEAAALAARTDAEGVVGLADELAWLEDSGRATDSVMVDKLVAVARRHSAHLEEAGPTPVFHGDVVFIGSTPDEEEPYTADPTTWDPFVDGALAEHHVGFPHHRLMTHRAIEELGPLVRRLLAEGR
jgi:amino acid adenylation domain-containing protein/non-ribosomal peptide synthase protein (TIGR01720 family)